jgi:hypothetical protein
LINSRERNSQNKRPPRRYVGAVSLESAKDKDEEEMILVMVLKGKISRNYLNPNQNKESESQSKANALLLPSIFLLAFAQERATLFSI